LLLPSAFVRLSWKGNFNLWLFTMVRMSRCAASLEVILRIWGKNLVSKASWTRSNFHEWHHVTVWRQQMWSVAAFELCSTLWWSWTWNPSLILLWTLPHCTLWPVGAYTQSCLIELQWIWNWISVVLRLPIGHCVISCSGCEEFYLCWCYVISAYFLLSVPF
jgi:hypothetical protein